MKGIVAAVCVSAKRGAKENVGSCRAVAGLGLSGDVHARGGIRQVSLLSLASIEKMRSKGVDVSYGAFGENIVVSGMRVDKLPVSSRLKVGGAILEVSKIGKECHTPCIIGRTIGECVMPSEGVFAVVAEGGMISVGDTVTLIGE